MLTWGGVGVYIIKQDSRKIFNKNGIKQKKGVKIWHRLQHHGPFTQNVWKTTFHIFPPGFSTRVHLWIKPFAPFYSLSFVWLVYQSVFFRFLSFSSCVTTCLLKVNKTFKKSNLTYWWIFIFNFFLPKQTNQKQLRHFMKIFSVFYSRNQLKIKIKFLNETASDHPHKKSVYSPITFHWHLFLRYFICRLF